MALSSAQLEAFIAVAQTLSFTQAAERLYITQSALSQRVLNLEKELETTLFIRDRSGLKLTEVGSKLVRYCQLKNSLEDDFLAGLKSKDSIELAGVLRIGGFSSVMCSVVLPSLANLLKTHRKLKIQTVSREMSDLLNLLKRGEIDYMILGDHLDKEELERVALGVEKNVLVEAKNYSGPDIYLDHDEADQTTASYLRRAKKSAQAIERLFLDDIYGVIEGAKLGLGRAVVPRHLIQNEKKLTVLNPNLTLDVPVYLYYYLQPYYPNLHAQVVASLKEGFRAQLENWL